MGGKKEGGSILFIRIGEVHAKKCGHMSREEGAWNPGARGRDREGKQGGCRSSRTGTKEFSTPSRRARSLFSK